MQIFEIPKLTVDPLVASQLVDSPRKGREVSFPRMHPHLRLLLRHDSPPRIWRLLLRRKPAYRQPLRSRIRQDKRHHEPRASPHSRNERRSHLLCIICSVEWSLLRVLPLSLRIPYSGLAEPAPRESAPPSEGVFLPA